MNYAYSTSLICYRMYRRNTTRAAVRELDGCGPLHATRSRGWDLSFPKAEQMSAVSAGRLSESQHFLQQRYMTSDVPRMLRGSGNPRI